MPTAPRVDEQAAARLPDPTSRLPWFLAELAHHGDVVAFSQGGRDRVLVNDPAFVTKFLQESADDTRAAPISDTASTVTGDGLLVSADPRWLPRRKLVQRELSHRSVRRHLDALTATTRAWLTGLSDGRQLDLHHEVTGLTLANLGEAVFASDFRPLAPLVSRVMAGLLTTSAQANSGVVDAAAQRRLADEVARVDRQVEQLIAQRRMEPAPGQDVLGVMVEAARAEDEVFHSRWVRDEALTLIIAGHDTTALLTTMTLSLLARHPQVHATLRQELAAARADGVPDAQLCEVVPLVRLVLQEALRLYPPVPVLHRLATKDVQVQGFTVPAGDLLVFSAWVQHRDSRWFVEPEAFDPWRFAADRRDEWGQAYLPFGAGRRICAGNHFATLEAAVIVTLVTLYADLVTLPDEPELEYAVALRLVEGLPAQVWARAEESS